MKDENATIKLTYSTPGEKDKVESVKFIFPEEYFEKNKVTFSAEEIRSNKTIDIQMWKSFPMEAEIILKSGKTYNLKTNVEPKEAN